MLVLVPQRMWEASTFYFLKPVNMLCYKVKGGLHTQTRSWTILVYNPQPPRAHNTVGEIDIYKKKKKFTQIHEIKVISGIQLKLLQISLICLAQKLMPTSDTDQIHRFLASKYKPQACIALMFCDYSSCCRVIAPRKIFTSII